MLNNPDEFINEEGLQDMETFMDFKIDMISKSTERVKYTLDLTLLKDGDNWKMDDITEIDRQKIHGIYNY